MSFETENGAVQFLYTQVIKKKAMNTQLIINH